MWPYRSQQWRSLRCWSAISPPWSSSWLSWSNGISRYHIELIFCWNLLCFPVFMTLYDNMFGIVNGLFSLHLEPRRCYIPRVVRTGILWRSSVAVVKSAVLWGMCLGNMCLNIWKFCFKLHDFFFQLIHKRPLMAVMKTWKETQPSNGKWQVMSWVLSFTPSTPCVLLIKVGMAGTSFDTCLDEVAFDLTRPSAFGCPAGIKILTVYITFVYPNIFTYTSADIPSFIIRIHENGKNRYTQILYFQC